MTRKLDALVHMSLFPDSPIDKATAFGFDSVHSWRDVDDKYELYASGADLPNYSTDIAAAWQVVEKMKSITPEYEIVWDCAMEHWEVTWEYIEDKYARFAIADTAPIAICIAALRAVCVLQEEIDAAMEDGNDN